MLTVAGLRQEQDMYIRLIDSATKQVIVASSVLDERLLVSIMFNSSLTGVLRYFVFSKSLLVTNTIG